MNKQLERPKYYHLFKLSYLWPEITKGLLADNKKLKVDVAQMQCVKNEAVTLKQKTTLFQMSLADAWEKMQKETSEDYALFATHLKIPEYDSVKYTISKLPPFYRINAQNDLQKYYLATLNGLNEVQFFVKGKGAWTGFHGEDCLLSSFNINMGPGSSRWTIIPMKEHRKLSKCLQQVLQKKQSLDIRNHWHSYYFSEDFLKKNNIEYEVVVQDPGYAIFVGGCSLHQVINLGPGMNMAWNLAPFSLETIALMIEGYEFEKTEQQKVSMVPVLRVIHILLFKYFEKFSSQEIERMARFLERGLREEEHLHQQLVENEKVKMSIEELATEKSLPENNCFYCLTAFYLRYYVIKQNKKDVYLCANCAILKVKSQAISCTGLVDVEASEKALSELCSTESTKSLSEQVSSKCAYPGQGDHKLIRIDAAGKPADNVQVAQNFDKEQHLKNRLEEAKLEQSKWKQSLADVKNSKNTEHLRKKIKKKQVHIDQLNTALRKISQNHAN